MPDVAEIAKSLTLAAAAERARQDKEIVERLREQAVEFAGSELAQWATFFADAIEAGEV